VWRKSIRTDYRMWAIFATVILVVLGNWNWLPENVKSAVTYWQQWAIFLSGDYGGHSGDFLFALLFIGLIWAIPAIIFGWVAQAVVGVLRTLRARPEGTTGNSS
jgi:hypothetical protein